MKKNIPASFDAILLLGLQLQADGRPGEEMLLRAQRAAALHTEAPDRKIIACGGETRPGYGTEAQALKQALVKLGVPPEDILLEDQSLITAENIRNARALLGGGATVVALVTSDYHGLRASLLCKRNGVRAIRYDAKTARGSEKLLKRFLEILFLADTLLGFAEAKRDRPAWLSRLSRAIVNPTYKRLGKVLPPEKAESDATNQHREGYE